MLRAQRDETTWNIVKDITEAAWPFALNRGAEMAVDFYLASLFDQKDAAALMGAMIIVLRSIPATTLFFTPQATVESKEPQQKAHVLRKAYLLSLYLTAASNIAAHTSQFTLPLFRLPHQSITTTQNFLHWYAPGLIFTFANIANQQWCIATGRQKTVLVMTLANSPLPTLLIAHLLLPYYHENALGIAYSVSALLQFVSYTVFFRLHSDFKDYQIFNFENFFERDPVFYNLFHKGKWISAYAGLELGSVTFSAVLIGQYGQDALSALLPAQQYASFLANFTFSWALSLGIIIKRIIKELPELAKKFGQIGALMCLGFTGSVFITFLATNDLMLKPFLKDDASEQIKFLAFYLMLTNMIGQLWDGFRNAYTANLRGIGNTSYASKVNAATVVFINVPASLITKFALHLGVLAVLPPRIFSIMVSTLLIGNKWRKEINKHINGDIEQPLIAGVAEREENHDKYGCLSRCWARLMGRKPVQTRRYFELGIINGPHSPLNG